MPRCTASRFSSGAIDALLDQLLQAVVDGEDLEDPGAPEIAGAAAVSAALSLHHSHPFAGRDREVERLCLLVVEIALASALAADLAHEALAPWNPIRVELIRKGLDVEIDQARDRRGCIVGVERGEHEVTGERRLNRVSGRSPGRGSLRP